MRAYFGKDFAAHKLRNEDVNVVWEATQMQNGHILFIGGAGAGKTTQLKRFIGGLLESSSDVRFHVFDVHGDLDLPGASEVMFSELTPYGLNPLSVSPNPHFGGVRKCIQSFLRIISKATGALGARQEALLRKILLDVYRQRGFDPENPETWLVDPETAHLVTDPSGTRFYLDIPFADKDAAKELRTCWWDAEIRVPGRNGLWWCRPEDYTGAITRWLPMAMGRMPPTLNDVLIYANRLLKISFMGSDEEAIRHLEIFQKAVAKYQREELALLRAGGRNRPDGMTDSQSPLDRAKGRCLESYGRFLDAMRTGRELEDQIKYDSVEQLKSVVDRLETLRATGLFKGEMAPFDPGSAIWRYQLNSLLKEEKRLFVLFRLQELFYEAIERGHQNRIRDVLVLDEVHLYVDEDGDDVLSTLAREARKFGVAVVAANQTATLPEGFITSLGTKVVLGIDHHHHQLAISKMGMTKELLKWIQPKSTMAVNMRDGSKTSGEWRGVMLRKPVAPGARAPAYAQGAAALP